MKYINFILTLIAVLLLIVILKMPMDSARAGSGIQDINIVEIGGNMIYDGTIKVRIRK